MNKEKTNDVSIWRLRLGVLLIIFWWLPIYLTVPSITAALGDTGNAHAIKVITFFIITIQTIIGITGFLLVGKSLASNLRKVSTKKLPKVFWEMLWHGNQDIPDSALKVKKPKDKKDTRPVISNGPFDLAKMLKSKEYVRLLVIASVLGIIISAVAFFFLSFINHLQGWVYFSIPPYLGFHGTPNWWVLLPLLVAGIFTGYAIKYLPGKGGHVPADGLQANGHPYPVELPGIILAAIASISLGAVVGPEAPLIAIGGGLAYLIIKLVKKNIDEKTGAVIAVVGSFAAISTLFGSPLLAAFLLMEASGLGGEMATAVLVPGLLGAGIGSLIFIGINSLTGLGTSSLIIPNLPHFTRPNVNEFLWAIAIGLMAALIGTIIKRIGLTVKDKVTKNTMVVVISAGIIIAILAMVYSHFTGHSNVDVLFSGQSDLPYLLSHTATYTVGALIALLIFKGLAYGLSLGSFRGGPVFPSLFLGGALGIALSHFGGLPLTPAVAMGIGALCASMLRLPMTSVLLGVLLISSGGLAVMPLVIVAVVVSFVASTRLLPIVKKAA